MRDNSRENAGARADKARATVRSASPWIESEILRRLRAGSGVSTQLPEVAGGVPRRGEDRRFAPDTVSPLRRLTRRAFQSDKRRAAGESQRRIAHPLQD